VRVSLSGVIRLVLALLTLGLACSDDGERGDDFGSVCTAGTTTPCTCPPDREGIATCGPEGVFGACACGNGTETAGDSGSAATEGGSTACADGCSSGAPDEGTTSCADGPRIHGVVVGVSVPWTDGATTGLAAGAAKCTNSGADHLCDYEEVKAAALAGELDAMDVGSTAWIHRTTIETVAAEPSAPGSGGRCIDWTATADTLADGEYLEVGADGPVFVLDVDTFYDGLDPSHADPTAMPCIGIARALLCCNPVC
jgi:hypothetical protein